MVALMLLQRVSIYFAIFLLGLGDAVTTRLAVIHGNGQEANPIAQKIINYYGMPLGLVLMQTFFILIMSGMYFYANKIKKEEVKKGLNKAILLILIIKAVIVFCNSLLV